MSPTELAFGRSAVKDRRASAPTRAGSSTDRVGAVLAATAVEVGVSRALLSRLRNGYKPDAEGFMTLVRWLGMEAEILVDEAAESSQPELMAEYAPLLRACKDLDEDDIEYLQDVIRATRRPRVRLNGHLQQI